MAVISQSFLNPNLVTVSFVTVQIVVRRGMQSAFDM